jgi:hypothetical protein
MVSDEAWKRFSDSQAIERLAKLEYFSEHLKEVDW